MARAHGHLPRRAAGRRRSRKRQAGRALGDRRARRNPRARAAHRLRLRQRTLEVLGHRGRADLVTLAVAPGSLVSTVAPTAARERLLSLDVFRGMTVAGMLL